VSQEDLQQKWQDFQALTNRLGEMWTMVGVEIGLSGQPKGSLRHLATALLLDVQVRTALAPLQWPTPDQLRLALTNTEPIEEQLRKHGVQRGPNLIIGPSTYWSMGYEDEIPQFLQRVLGDNELEGLMAHLRLLQQILKDADVKQSLAKILDVPALESSLEAAQTNAKSQE
jgi:hypothetical protein